MTAKRITYRQAGVDLGKYDALMEVVKKALATSSESSVCGLFAGVLDLGAKGRSRGLIVATVDGVGTKSRIATEVGWHVGIGRDIVAHCANDILCLGARPVAFMDYIGFAQLDTKVFRQVLRGISAECKKHAIEVIGGETAEMPGVYSKGEYELVGFMIGLATRRRMLDGTKIRKGDLVVGLPSNGLHTNGFSLARHVLLKRGRMKLTHRPQGWRQSLGKALLRPHVNYMTQVYPLIRQGLLAGLAHVTGGGIAGNLARILPPGCGARLRKSLWHVPPVFDLVAAAGPVDEEEMFRVFNMGLGMLLIVSHSALPEVMRQTRSSRVVGEIVRGDGEVVIE